MGSSYGCIVACAHLGNGTGHRTVAMAATLLVSQRGMKLCFTVVGKAQLGDGYRLVTVCTHGDFIALPHWNTRPLTGTITCYSTKSHFPDNEPTSPFPILIMSSARVNLKSHWLDSTRVRSTACEACVLLIRPPRLVSHPVKLVELSVEQMQRWGVRL